MGRIPVAYVHDEGGAPGIISLVEHMVHLEGPDIPPDAVFADALCGVTAACGRGWNVLSPRPLPGIHAIYTCRLCAAERTSIELDMGPDPLIVETPSGNVGVELVAPEVGELRESAGSVVLRSPDAVGLCHSIGVSYSEKPGRPVTVTYRGASVTDEDYAPIAAALAEPDLVARHQHLLKALNMIRDVGPTGGNLAVLYANHAIGDDAEAGNRPHDRVVRLRHTIPGDPASS